MEVNVNMDVEVGQADRQVPEQVKLLQDRIDTYAILLSELDTAVRTVTYNEAQKKVEVGNDERIALVPLAQEIRDAVDQIENLNDRLRHTIASIELQ